MLIDESHYDNNHIIISHDNPIMIMGIYGFFQFEWLSSLKNAGICTQTLPNKPAWTIPHL